MTGSPGDADRVATIADGTEVETRVKGSRFRASAHRVESEDECAARLAAARRAYHDATHHCSAYRVGPDDPVERSDDDGEPSGTAGAPILHAIRGRDLWRTQVIVTRWYGGTKLGTGGLARAYGEAAALALDAAPRRTLRRVAAFEVTCAWDDVGAVEAVLARHGGAVVGVERTFDETPTLRVTALRTSARAVASDIVEATAARARTGPESLGLA